MKVCQVLSGLSLSLLTLHLQAAPQTNFGDRGNSNTNNNQQQQQQLEGGSEEDVDNKIFFGNSNLNNILLGAALGAGGALVTQEILNGQNNNEQCNCGPARKKRQVQDQDQAGDQKMFGLLGGCDCGSPPASVEFGADCKGRPEGNPYYGCGCSDNAAGGLFTFGRRRKRQINIDTPSSSSSSSTSGEDVDNRFPNFRCLDAALTGRNQNKPLSTED